MKNKKMIVFTLFLISPIISYWSLVYIMPNLLDYSLVLSSLIFSFSLLALLYFALVIVMVAVEGLSYGYSKVLHLFQEASSVFLHKSHNVRVAG